MPNSMFPNITTKTTHREIMNTTATLTILAGSLLCATTGAARQTEAWSYNRLFQQADVVVIASAGNTLPTKQKWAEPLFDPQQFRGVITHFRVASTLKGSPSQSIKIFHYAYANSQAPINDGPTLVSFISGPVSLDMKPLQQGITETKFLAKKRETRSNGPEYLLFLKKRQDGSFVAVSGQIDPSFSVRAIFNMDALQNN